MSNPQEVNLGDVAGQTATLTMSNATTIIANNNAVWSSYSDSMNPSASVGVNGGTGSMTMTGNSVFAITANGVSQGNGSLCFEIGCNAYASGSTGTVTVGGNSTLSVGNGYGGTGAAGNYLLVGEDGSVGTLTITGSALVQADNLVLGSERNFYTTGGSGALRLNGGTLSVGQVANDAATTGNLYFNGGMLQVTAGGPFITSNGTLNAYVSTHGTMIDSNGNDITLGVPLLHDPSLGSDVDGGLTKVGSGTLTLTAANTYTGPTTICGGTLSLGGVNGPGYNLPTATALSIAPGGVLDMGGNDQPVGSLSGSAGAIIANNLVHSKTYTSTLTVSPTFRRNDVRREHRRLDAVEPTATWR